MPYNYDVFLLLLTLCVCVFKEHFFIFCLCDVIQANLRAYFDSALNREFTFTVISFLLLGSMTGKKYLGAWFGIDCVAGFWFFKMFL